jgi:hypothetical protein
VRAAISSIANNKSFRIDQDLLNFHRCHQKVRVYLQTNLNLLSRVDIDGINLATKAYLIPLKCSFKVSFSLQCPVLPTTRKELIREKKIPENKRRKTPVVVDKHR